MVCSTRTEPRALLLPTVYATAPSPRRVNSAAWLIVPEWMTECVVLSLTYSLRKVSLSIWTLFSTWHFSIMKSLQDSSWKVLQAGWGNDPKWKLRLKGVRTVTQGAFQVPTAGNSRKSLTATSSCETFPETRETHLFENKICNALLCLERTWAQHPAVRRFLPQGVLPEFPVCPAKK